MPIVCFREIAIDRLYWILTWNLQYVRKKVQYLLFPLRNQVYLANIEDQIEIMQSLQLPKKITLRGSDGKSYIMMCKPKVSVHDF